MARPTKSITTITGYMSKNEVDARIEYEAKLRGESDRIRPPSFLSKDQRKLFKGIVGYLIPSGILGNMRIGEINLYQIKMHEYKLVQM